MKFDMSQAWSQAMAMLTANRDLVAIVAGVFFFLPYLALMLMAPDLTAELPKTEPGTDPQVMMDAFTAIYARIWPALLAVIVFQSVGSLALLALLHDSTRPTLGEALKLGLLAFLPYLGAQIVICLGMVLAGVVLIGGGAAINAALGVLAMFAVAAGAIYVLVKFSMTMPVMGVERVYNPLAALTRSWRLTKGNSLRLFAFFFLIIVAGLIVVSVIQMILGLLFAAFGAQAQAIGNGVVSSLLNAVWATVVLAVIAAAHRQLTRGGASAPPMPNG